MKVLYLTVKNSVGDSWIIFEREDGLPFLLPTGTIFEAVNNYLGVVVNHYYNEGEDQFITKIDVISVARFQLGYFKENLLKKGWKVQYEDRDLMLRDKCE